MNAYLLKFQHKNASTGENVQEMWRAWVCDHASFWVFSAEDLWDCLEEASGKPIAAVMGSWTKQMGFPIIVVDQEQVRFMWIYSVTRMKFVFSRDGCLIKSSSWFGERIFMNRLQSFPEQTVKFIFFFYCTLMLVLFLARWRSHPQDIAEEVLCQRTAQWYVYVFNVS